MSLPLFFIPSVYPLIGDSLLCYYFAGSVSVGVWQIACRRLIVVGEKAVKSFAGKPIHLYHFFFSIVLSCIFSHPFILLTIADNIFQHPRILTPRTITSAFLHWLLHPITHQGKAKRMTIEEHHDMRHYFEFGPPLHTYTVVNVVFVIYPIPSPPYISGL